MRKIFAWAAMATMIALAWSSDHALAATQKKTPAKKSSAKTTTEKKSTATSSSSKKGSTSASSKGKKGVPTMKSVTWRNRQSAPSSDRYREIQGALAARGYLNSEDATGSWNQASIDAMKKFQSEQNLDSSGKINSLSLIALGLGPRRDAVAAVPKPPPAPPQFPGPGQ
jgi:endonuclease I